MNKKCKTVHLSMPTWGPSYCSYKQGRYWKARSQWFAHKPQCRFYTAPSIVCQEPMWQHNGLEHNKNSEDENIYKQSNIGPIWNKLSPRIITSNEKKTVTLWEKYFQNCIAGIKMSIHPILNHSERRLRSGMSQILKCIWPRIVSGRIQWRCTHSFET
jgi:hypothetical protein